MEILIKIILILMAVSSITYFIIGVALAVNTICNVRLMKKNALLFDEIVSKLSRVFEQELEKRSMLMAPDYPGNVFL